MAAALNAGVADLIGNRELISSLKLEEFADETVGMPALEFIREELLAPGKDPRGAFVPPRFRAEIRDIADLKEGLTLEGSVTNVTNFGAFVDIGIHQDGLVHLSQMSNRFIRDPREAVKVGDLVQVKVISIEVETKRIGLSMKALLPAVPRRRRKPRRREGAPVPEAPAAAATETASPITAAMDAPGKDAQAAPANREQIQRPGRRGGPPRRRGDGRPRRGDAHPRNGDASPRSSDVTARRNDARKPELPPPPPPEPDPEPKGPEPTFQEKIAILQSKFRGIN
jgi:predicted RNA-binding protein with RPS1 domain